MLAFIVKLIKSVLVSSQVMLHLGAMINTAWGVPPIPCQAGDNCARSSGIALSGSGVTWMPPSGDRSNVVLLFLSSAVHVSSPPTVDSPDELL